ncbi:SDR family NAD(P)-dependent oxidoreductase [Poseidonocella sedimentorum]|uniref:NADP-dependent 3-hydroxy acid dehydrogenase YdfG n=1 Tax=Poseidonocella sedimentorum TaxID=871652 RepID=A0A1I6CMS2_9RHOB|nr:SDR family NAD(P)-dependent oxidoreductase [Poseidonocella sedimentorum]SFQ94484.1 NADP-dependent 3-hydroxy acid dehydrogenase YdfG [Poseidonocella sedimentorum]
MTDHTQDIALITGASRGLGAALAEALAPRFHIVAVGRTTGALEELDDRIKAKGGSATLAPMDIADAAAMATLCRGIHDRWGKVDLWAHAAIHAAPLAPAQHLDEKDWQRSQAVNADATQRLIVYLAPLLGAEGRAVFFDDPRAGESFFGNYGATKAAQMALARSWQSESRRTGPRVDILAPKPMPTATRARFHPGENRDALADPRDEAARILAELGL